MLQVRLYSWRSKILKAATLAIVLEMCIVVSNREAV